MSLLMDIGLYVKCVVCDQGSSNQKLVKLLNVTIDKPYFVKNENKVFVFYDPPHLLKSVRNNLQKHNLMLDDHILCWAYLQKLYQIESSKTTMRRHRELKRKWTDWASWLDVSVGWICQHDP